MVERTLITLPSQLQLIERLQHLIYLSSSLIFVSGETGSGKSTLTENLSNSLNIDLQQIYISLSNTPTVDKLRQQIIGQIYDHPLFNSEDNLLDSILRLQASESKDSNKLLIIDNANYLPEGFVLELCELFSGDDFIRDSTLSILLLADEKTNQQYLDYIEDNLIARMQASLDHVEFKLPPLSAKESLSLLQHNFQQAAYQPELDSQEALAEQLKDCAGNPKKIIQLADNLSQGNVLPSRNYWLKTALPATLLMLLLIAGVSALGTYLYPKFITAKKIDSKILQEKVEEKTPKDVLLEHLLIQEERMQEALAGEWDDIINTEIEENQKEVGLSEQQGQRVVFSDDELMKLVDTAETNIQKVIQKDDDGPITSLPLTSTKYKSSLLKSEHEEFLEISSQQKEDNSNLLSSIGKQFGIDTNDEASVETVPKVVQPSIPNVEVPIIKTVLTESNDNEFVQTENGNSSEKGLLEENVQNEDKKPELPKSNIVLVKNVPEELTPISTLLNKAPRHYTLQLSGMASKRYLELFKKESKFPQENLFLYETVYKNKPWFVVLYGDYDSRNAARLAAKTLPEIFDGMPHWVKRWQLVHNELRLNDE